MHYSNRYYYALAICLLMMMIGIFYDGLPQYHTWYTLTKNKKVLQRKILKEKLLQKQMPRVVHESFFSIEEVVLEFLSHLSDFLQKEKLKLIALQFVPEKNREILLLHLQIVGKWSAINHWLHDVVRQKYAVQLMDFSVNAYRQEQIKIAINLALFSFRSSVSSSIIRKLEAPKHIFCGEPYQLFTKSSDSSRYALAAHELIGFMQQGNRCQGVVRLPNQYLYPVQVGSMLGKEKARVVKINECEISFADGRALQLKRK